MPLPLPRTFRRQLQAEDDQNLERILREVGEGPEPSSSAGATAGGDWKRLRGLPATPR